jgi:opacity protein-like surface antigen
MRKILFASSALVGAAMLAAPALAATDSEDEISALKVEIQQQAAQIQELQQQAEETHELAAEVAELKKQQTTQVSKVEQLQDQEATQDSKVEQLQKQEAIQEQEPSIERTAASGPHDWSGPYAGANVGAGMASGSITSVKNASLGSEIFSDAFAQGGIHTGYNYQMKNTVLGIEAEANLGGQDHTGELSSQPSKSQIDWSSAILGRAGIAVGDTLFFVDAGPAVAHLNGSSFTGVHKFAVDTWTPGIKGGGGVEFMVTPDISLRAQYSILAVAQQIATVPVSVCGSGCSQAWSNLQQTATVGADWHF